MGSVESESIEPESIESESYMKSGEVVKGCIECVIVRLINMSEMDRKLFSR